MKEAGWPQRRNGAHLALVLPDHAADEFLVAYPNASEILAALLHDGRAGEAAEALAKVWISTRPQKLAPAK